MAELDAAGASSSAGFAEGYFQADSPPNERVAFRDMLAHELRGRELTAGDLRRVAERTWRTFLQRSWAIHGPRDVA